ncbi:MAG: serine/threonine-protein kinase [Gemmatimonadaceae bacterium]
MKSCPKCDREYDDATKFCPADGSTLRSAAGDDIIGSIIADRYHVIRKLGEGGMGQVYLAEHVKMGRMSAIKVMTSALANDVDAVGRFNREAANASKISHPNIAAIYDFGETSDGLIYLAMEFVEGESLTKLCEALGALPAPRAAEIARQVASALEAAHERGIVHRDLKPDNIMISRGRDGADLVKVVDFGIAKAAEGAGQKVTRTGLVVGTPEYMSPEQLTGDTLDGRSDLYALGLVTFNMLTGMLPFTGQTTQEALLKRLTDRPLSLAEARTDLVWPAPLQAVLDRVLSRLAADRYQHASEFGEAIVAAVRGMSAEEVERTRTLVIPATATGAATGAATTMPPAAPVVARPPATARERFLFPALLLVALFVAVGGAMFMRSRATGASVAVASAPHIDSAASSVSTAAPSGPAASADSGGDKSDSGNLSSASGVMGASAPKSDSVATNVGVAPPAAPEPTALPPEPATPPAGRKMGNRLRDRRAAAAVGRARTETPASTTAPPTAPVTPPAPPAFSTSSAPANAEQARERVEAAGRMVDADKSAEAMAAVRGAMPMLPTRDDSVTALYYLSRAMIKRAGTTGNEALRTRACSILSLITKATSHPKAGEIRSFSSQECK